MMNWCNSRSRTALTDPELQHKRTRTGHPDRSATPKELGHLLKSEIARSSALIKPDGIRSIRLSRLQPE